MILLSIKQIINIIYPKKKYLTLPYETCIIISLGELIIGYELARYGLTCKDHLNNNNIYNNMVKID